MTDNNTNKQNKSSALRDILRKAAEKHKQQHVNDAPTVGDGTLDNVQQKDDQTMTELRTPEAQESRLEAENKELREMVGDMQETLEKLMSNPYFVGIVMETYERGILISTEGRLMELATRDGLEVKRGDLVRLQRESMQIVDVYGDVDSLPGQMSMIKQVFDENYAEIEIGGNSHVVFVRHGLELRNGDRVALDPSNSMIVKNYGQDTAEFQTEIVANVGWDSIGGLEDAKRTLREAIEYPFRFADLYELYNQPATKGVLLHGPPGCGKTMLGKACAKSVADVHGVDVAASGFIYVKATQFLQKYVGVGEEMVRNVFRKARDHKEKNGYPATVFIDEADAVMKKRGSGVSTDVYDTIVAAFLSEMDGLESNGAIVILATNRQDMMDNAILRDERVSHKVYVSRPSKETAQDIFKMYLKDRPFYKDCDLDTAAATAAEELFSPDRILYEGKRPQQDSLKVTLGDLCNGAMCKGIVDTATSIAIARDIEVINNNGKPPREEQGIRKEDILNAVDRVVNENLALNREDEAKEVLLPYKKSITSIQKWVPTNRTSTVKA